MNGQELRDALRRDAELVGEPPGDLLERVEGLRRRSKRRRAGVAAAVVGVALLVAAIPVGRALLGRSDDGQTVVPIGAPTEPAEAPIELTAGDGCGDASFWGMARTDSGEIAVSVSIEARDRSTVDPTTWDFVVPDAGVTVEILQGQYLETYFCNDVRVGSEPARQGAVAGAGTITLDPRPEVPAARCGSVSGELELTGLVAADGTAFAPIRITTDSIGCYSG